MASRIEARLALLSHAELLSLAAEACMKLAYHKELRPKLKETQIREALSAALDRAKGTDSEGEEAQLSEATKAGQLRLAEMARGALAALDGKLDGGDVSKARHDSKAARASSDEEQPRWHCSTTA